MRTEKGFSLLELLVVIAIIGVISAVVLMSLNIARIKSRNSYITSSMLQYVNAFSMYFSTNGSYPSPSSDLPTAIKCLGHRTSQCGRITYNAGVLDAGSPFGDQNTQLDSEMETVFSAAPEFENVLYRTGVPNPDSETFFAGPLYECNYYIDGRCMSINLNWYLIGNDQACVRGATMVNDNLATSCTLTME